VAPRRHIECIVVAARDFPSNRSVNENFVGRWPPKVGEEVPDVRARSDDSDGRLIGHLRRIGRRTRNRAPNMPEPVTLPAFRGTRVHTCQVSEKPTHRTYIVESAPRADGHWWLRWLLNVDELPGGPWEVRDEKACPPRQVFAAGKSWSPSLEAPSSTFAWRTFHLIGVPFGELTIGVTPFETNDQAMGSLGMFPPERPGSVVEEIGIDWHSRVDRSSSGVVFTRSIPVDSLVPSCRGAVESVLFDIATSPVSGKSEPDWDLLLVVAADQVQKIRRILAEQT